MKKLQHVKKLSEFFEEDKVFPNSLKNELYDMFLTYQWEFNTTEIQDEIKIKANMICERYVNENKIYDFFNIMDDTNNSFEAINHGVSILDTYIQVEVGKGAIVNNLIIANIPN